MILSLGDSYHAMCTVSKICHPNRIGRQNLQDQLFYFGHTEENRIVNKHQIQFLLTVKGLILKWVTDFAESAHKSKETLGLCVCFTKSHTQISDTRNRQKYVRTWNVQSWPSFPMCKRWRCKSTHHITRNTEPMCILWNSPSPCECTTKSHCVTAAHPHRFWWSQNKPSRCEL